MAAAAAAARRGAARSARVEWSGVEWSGVEWSGVEWSGLEWSGTRVSTHVIHIVRTSPKKKERHGIDSHCLRGLCWRQKSLTSGYVSDT